MSSRRTATGVAVWAAVVLVGSTLVWGVISRVGAESSQQLRAAQPALSSTPELTNRPRSTPTRPSDRRSSSALEGGSGGRTSDSPGDAGEDGPSSPEGGGTSSSAVAGTTDSWSGSPGTVRATCRGTTLEDWSASPDPGWKLETEQEDGDLRAHFERGEDDEGEVEVEVTVTCTAAGPAFRVEN